MAFSAEARAKALASRKANAAKRAQAKSAHVEIASTAGVSNAREKALLEELKQVRSQLAVSEIKRTEAEASALRMAESQGLLMQTKIEEVPSGKSVTVKRLDHYKVVGHRDDGRDILRPVFKDVKLETYFYKIDMPAVGGMDLKINEVPFLQGAVYELDIDTLRTVKDMVHKLWRHEANTQGSNENAYRKPQHNVISARMG
jgi:hypothetical protein